MNLQWILPRSSALAAALLLSGSVAALDSIRLELGDLQGEGWRIQTLGLQLLFTPTSDLAGEISIASITMPEPIGRIDDALVRCERLVHDEKGTDCTGRMRIAHLLGEPVAGKVRVTHDARNGQVRVRLQEVAIAAGVWTADAVFQEAGWTFELKARRANAEALVALARRLDVDTGYSLSGSVDLDVRMRGAAAGVADIAFEVAGSGLDFANSTGTQAGEKLELALSGQGRLRAGIWQGDVHARFAAGALFIDPLYFEFNSAQPAQLAAIGTWSDTARRLNLQNIKLAHPGVIDAEGQLALLLGESVSTEALRLQVHSAQLPGAFDTYLQPWLRGQLGDALKTAGGFSGQVAYQANGDAALRIELSAVDIDDPRQRFGFERLTGVIDWSSDASPRTTELAWQSGSLYRLALGPTRFAVASTGTSFELREPFTVPVLDGQLMIDDLALSDPGGDDMRWRFDGVLTPVSMEAVCEALDWPPFGGQLSGMIPAVRYADKRLEIGGVLLVKAFDGDLTVRNLRLEEPLGRVPRLNADLALDNLDLEAVTRTFSFGKIEGRLSGYVNELYMEAWQPVAFDALFATPEDDDSRHRISQKAVDNLSSIGGGVGGALSRSFLGMFEEFPYDRIGLSCRLKNGICAMGGVAPAANGYYIVKGRFLPPRIDVVGYADRVDWHTLIDRLKSVTLDQAPTVQ